MSGIYRCRCGGPAIVWNSAASSIWGAEGYPLVTPVQVCKGGRKWPWPDVNSVVRRRARGLAILTATKGSLIPDGGSFVEQRSWDGDISKLTEASTKGLLALLRAEVERQDAEEAAREAVRQLVKTLPAALKQEPVEQITAESEAVELN